MTTRHPKILLLQARQPGDANAEHERECFANQCQLPLDAFHAYNMATEPVEPSILAGHDIVMVGGAGHFSIAEENFEWFGDYMELMVEIVRQQMPMFGSCFGFQALVRAFGGKVEAVPEMKELGTHELRLTNAGRSDSFFGEHPDRFDAQFGHKDSATGEPDELIVLGRTERCPIQAVRHPDLPILATQFHPEMTEEDNKQRYMSYLREYAEPGITPEEARRKAEAMHRPSPHANELLRHFLREVAGQRTPSAVRSRK